MDREALNKFNAPEVLGALFKALEAAGLHDAVLDLKRVGVARIVNDAWARRGEQAMSVTAMVQRVAARAKFAGLVEDYLGKKARLVAMARKDILDLVRQRPHFFEVQPVTTGLIRYLFTGSVPALRDLDLAKALWNLWENRGPSQSTGTEVSDLAVKYGRVLAAGGGNELGRLQAAAFGVALLRSTRQPNLAKYAEALFTKHLARELAENAPQQATGTPESPGAIFLRLYVEGEPYKSFAGMLWSRVVPGAEAAVALASHLLSEVNWHSLARDVGGDDSLVSETDRLKAQEYASQVGYGVVEAAGIATGLLMRAGQRAKAKGVADRVVSEFKDSLIQNSLVG